MNQDLQRMLVDIIAKPYRKLAEQNKKRFPYKMTCNACRRRLRDNDGKKIVYKQTLTRPRNHFSSTNGSSTITNVPIKCPACGNLF